MTNRVDIANSQLDTNDVIFVINILLYCKQSIEQNERAKEIPENKQRKEKVEIASKRITHNLDKAASQ